MKFHLKALAAALPLSHLLAANAQQQAAFDPVVVTATRQAARASELLSDTTVIGREEIEQAGQSSLEELLGRQPGVQFAANGGPGTNSSVFLRGAGSKHTLVLVDGLRLGSATSGDVPFSRIPLDQIERIEILRGPASSLYGADAIGGVIQIFTRRGDGDGQPRFNAHAGYGSYQTSDSGAGVSGGGDKFSYNLQAGYFSTRGFSAIRNPANPSFNPDRDGYYNRNFSGNFTFAPVKGHEIGLNLLYSSGVSQYDSTPKAKQFSNDEEVQVFSLHTRNRLNSLWTSTVRAGRSSDDSNNRADGVATSMFRTRQDQLSWQNDLKLPIGQALLAAEYLKQDVSSTTAYPVTERIIRSLQAGWNGSLDRHRLQLNLRRDDNSQFGGKNTGSAGYGYQFTPEWRGHASYGTAFRAPSFNELYFPNTFGALYAGNPNLKPESARNREVGADWERGSHHVSVVYYRNKVKDIIVGYPLQNVDHATLKGTTLGYDGHFGNWSAGLALDLQESRDDKTGKRLARRADEQFKTHLAYTTGAWQMGGEWQLVGRRYDDAANTKALAGYGLVNLFADYRIARDWSLFGRANNIFDKRYETVKDFGTPGANVFVGVRYAPK
ncbi:MAG: TonB-dependent receptor [Rhodocyclaceae bacterium]|nr:TonB-dependent receptor [Rhodocyclaceae bacterium]